MRALCADKPAGSPLAVSQSAAQLRSGLRNRPAASRRVRKEYRRLLWLPVLFPIQTMKTNPLHRSGLLIAILTWASLGAAARAEDPAPPGFDQVRDVPHGQVKSEDYDSKSLGFPRKLNVYLPPGYTNDKKYPLLYLLHGSGDDQTGWVVKGSANTIMDNLYADGKALPMIVVMPYGFTNKPGEPARNPKATPEERRKMAGQFEHDLLEDVIPFVESHYPVIADAKHRALAGLSMGGGQTMRIGPPHSDTFAWLGVF